MGVYRERPERNLSREKWERTWSVAERSRRERWAAGGVARVVHPHHGSVVVPHHSNYSALLNAAEVWGCDWLEIRDAQVWAAPGETPVPMPRIIK